MESRAIKIGDLSRATDLTTRTIRYYESLGLLAKPRRTASGYRLYDSEDIRRLEFVQQAKGLGMSLGEIKEVLALHDQHQAPCDRVMDLVRRKIEEVDAAIQEMREFREGLARLRDGAAEQSSQGTGGQCICHIVEASGFQESRLPLAWLEGRRAF